MNLLLIFALAIGFAAGLRSLTAPAVVAWAAHVGWLNLQGSPLVFLGSMPAVVILSIAAIGELVGDKLPIIPKRTALPPLLARILAGATSGAALCVSANYSLVIGALLGGLGGVIGAFAGYEIRRRLTTGLDIRDLFIAVPEDLIAIGLSLFLVTR